MGCVRTKPNNPIIVANSKTNYESKNNFLECSVLQININNSKKEDSSSMIKETSTKKLQSGMNIKISTRNMIKQYRPNLIDEKYKILNKLGKGAFGSVYKIVQKSTGIIRAMKVIKKESIKYQDDEKLFLKEIEILISVDHPNVIRIYEYYKDDINFYLITEFVSGGDLYDEITKFKNFNENKAAYIMYQILSAVNYLHSYNIVHRDIKPENILVERKELNEDKLITIKLIDFGTCNYYSNDKNLTLKVGTPYYIAPEVLERNYNQKIDVWSCGVILFILLCGYPPFNGKTSKDILESVKKGVYSIEGKDWKFISAEAKDLVIKMLEYNPENRIDINQAINHSFIKRSYNLKKVPENKLNNVLTNIKNFNAKEKFQQAAMAYIVHFFFSSSELDDLRIIFQKLDINGDGRLTYNELRNGFDQVFGYHMTDIDFNNIIEDVDQDKNGFIEYQEFLRVGLCRRELLSEVNLKNAFEKMDENGDGKLSIQEIKNLLATSENDYINELLNSFDTNKDSEISYTEFVDIMRKITYTPVISPRKLPNEKSVHII